MATQIQVSDLKVGYIILDGIASRVEAIIPPDMTTGYSVFVTDGNGYSSMIRLSEDATVTHFDDWTSEDWDEFRAL